MVTSPPPLNQISTTFDENTMLAATLISLLLVLLFCFVLYAFTKWLLSQPRFNNHQNLPSVSFPGVFGSHFHTFTIETAIANSFLAKGLESSIISSIPLFVYKEGECTKHGMECVICLTGFEEGEVGRKLPKCGHAFHVECIDMWLHSHSTCPICRSSVVEGEEGKNLVEISSSSSSGSSSEGDDHRSPPMVEIIVQIPM